MTNPFRAWTTTQSPMTQTSAHVQNYTFIVFFQLNLSTHRTHTVTLCSSISVWGWKGLAFCFLPWMDHRAEHCVCYSLIYRICWSHVWDFNKLTWMLACCYSTLSGLYQYSQYTKISSITVMYVFYMSSHWFVFVCGLKSTFVSSQKLHESQEFMLVDHTVASGCFWRPFLSMM